MFGKKSLYLVAMLFLIAAVTFVLTAQPVDTSQQAIEETKPTLAKVSYLTVQPSVHQGIISVYGEVKPHWSITLQSAVEGQVLSINALAGEKVSAGQQIIIIEDSSYQSALAQAEQGLAQANLQLVEEQTRLQLKGRQLDAIESLPSIELALKTINAAKARVKEAQTQLEHTQVTAPFSGILTKRHISLGQMLNRGDVLFELINHEQLDIELHLSEQQWQLLNDDWQQHQAALFDENGDRLGFARIKRGGGYVAANTRQYSIFLEVDLASLKSELVPGSFVQVALVGKTITNSLVIPETALTRQGDVWFIDNNNRLLKTQANVLYHHNNQVVLAANTQTEDNNSLRLVVHPMSSYLPGELVLPVNAAVELN